MTSLATIVEGKVAEPKPVHPIVEMITSEKARAYIESFLPEGVDIQRVAASLMLAIKNDKSGKLAECTRESLVLGVAKIQQWGLELGVTAHLLPFSNKGTMEATPVADYKGLAELMIATGAVRFIEPKVVYAGDTFSYKFGTNATIDHTPCAKTKRGPITHGYILIHLPGGRIVFDVMAAEDVDEIRQAHSKQWKNGPLQSWYVKKTLVRQASKLIPKNPRLAEKLTKALAVLDDDRSVEIEDAIGSSPVNALRANVGDDDDDDRMQAVNDQRDERWPSDASDEGDPF